MKFEARNFYKPEKHMATHEVILKGYKISS